MKKLCVYSCVAFAFATAMSGCGTSPIAPRPATIVFTAQLSPANEVPPITNADATGSGTVTITIHDVTYKDISGDPIAGTADFQVTLSNFPLATQVTAAHIHTGTTGVAGGVVLDTGLTGAGGATLVTGGGSFTRTGIAVDGALLEELINHPASYYFNVHTQLTGTGAARGQLVKQ